MRIKPVMALIVLCLGALDAGRAQTELESKSNMMQPVYVSRSELAADAATRGVATSCVLAGEFRALKRRSPSIGWRSPVVDPRFLRGRRPRS